MLHLVHKDVYYHCVWKLPQSGPVCVNRIKKYKTMIMIFSWYTHSECGWDMALRDWHSQSMAVLLLPSANQGPGGSPVCHTLISATPHVAMLILHFLMPISQFLGLLTRLTITWGNSLLCAQFEFHCIEKIHKILTMWPIFRVLRYSDNCKSMCIKLTFHCTKMSTFTFTSLGTDLVPLLAWALLEVCWASHHLKLILLSTSKLHCIKCIIG